MKSAIDVAKAAGHVNISTETKVTTLELSAESQRERALYLSSLKVLEVNKRARTMIVPTKVDEVKDMLRYHRQPVTLFGENAFDRRERLKKVLAALAIDREGAENVVKTEGDDKMEIEGKNGKQGQDAEQIAKVTYSNCEPEMILARDSITKFSFEKAKERVQKESSDASTYREYCTNVRHRATFLQLNASAVSEQRPLMRVRFDPSGQFIATGSMGAQVKIWDRQALEGRATLVGHQERITAIAWHPAAHFSPGEAPSSGGLDDEDRIDKKGKGGKKRSWSVSQDESASGATAGLAAGVSLGVAAGKALLASASADGKCLLWNVAAVNPLQQRERIPILSPLHTFSGHGSAVTDCAFHPMGSHMVTAGADFSWRFWDVESGKELLLQDGHPSECTSIAFQPDGSLLLSGDSSGYVFLWDLRSGKRVLVLEGHADKVTSSSFHPNGFEVATSSLDNMVRIWDIRKKSCKYQIPAHSQPITHIRYSKSGAMLLSSSFDGTIKVYSAAMDSNDKFAPCYPKVASLKGHSGKVMAADFSPEEDAVASVGFDRTLKLWCISDK